MIQQKKVNVSHAEGTLPVFGKQFSENRIPKSKIRRLHFYVK